MCTHLVDTLHPLCQTFIFFLIFLVSESSYPQVIYVLKNLTLMSAVVTNIFFWLGSENIFPMHRNIPTLAVTDTSNALNAICPLPRSEFRPSSNSRRRAYKNNNENRWPDESCRRRLSLTNFKQLRPPRFRTAVFK